MTRLLCAVKRKKGTPSLMETQIKKLVATE